jgi:DNA-binding phage protein
MSETALVDIYAELNAAIARPGGQAALAAEARVTRQHVNRVVNGTSPPGPKLLRALGLRRVVRYVRTNGGPDA